MVAKCFGMVKRQAWWLPLAACLLLAAATLRGAEYDEQYTLFLTAGTPRPAWPETIFPAGDIARAQRGTAGPVEILRDLRTTDVHPPLYFWLLTAWRHVFGPSLLVSRLFSVQCGLVSLVLLSRIARQVGIPPAPAIAMTIGCYGFIYTNAIARNFALAELLTLTGTWLLLRGKHALGAGLLFGGACATNYLAVFPAAALILVTGGWLTAIGMLPGLTLDAWCFLAQHASRDGQFPPFALMPSLLRVMAYWTAGLFGGLPLYWTGTARITAALLIAVVALLVVVKTRIWRGPRPLLAAAIAPAIGLLLLGAIFDNTPIELRYLCFALPFCALLLARRGMVPVVALVLVTQACGIAGLLFAPRTMQPGLAASHEAATLSPGTLVLLPYGVDGVGVVGAFGVEADPATPILLIQAADTPRSLLARIGATRRVALALMAQDSDSVAAIQHTQAALLANGWQRTRIAAKIEVYERADPTTDRQTPRLSDRSPETRPSRSSNPAYAATPASHRVSAADAGPAADSRD
jgi:hypothetical protein